MLRHSSRWNEISLQRVFFHNRFYYTKHCETLKNALSTPLWDPKEIRPVRLDDGTSDIDTLDGFEYSFEKFTKVLQR